MGGGKGIVFLVEGVLFKLKEDIEDKVEVDVFGCIVVDSELNDVVKFLVVDVVEVFCVWLIEDMLI